MGRKKISTGVYEFKGFRIVRNIFGDYGHPKSAWIVSEPTGDELGPTPTLVSGIKWINDIISYKKR